MLFLLHGLTSFFSFRLGPAFLLYLILRIENNGKMIGRLQVGNVGGRFEDWKGDGKNATLVNGTRDGDVPTVGTGDSPCQTESQTDARGRSTLITSVESIKNAGEIIWRYAKASIFYSDGDVSFKIL
jgi:hypothetical protein